MNQSDRIKLVLAGFTIIRGKEIGKMGEQKPYIVTTENGYSWKLYEGPFNSKSSRDHRKHKLLLNDKIVED